MGPSYSCKAVSGANDPVISAPFFGSVMLITAPPTRMFLAAVSVKNNEAAIVTAINNIAAIFRVESAAA